MYLRKERTLVVRSWSERAALGRSKRQCLLPNVVEDVHVLLLVVSERAHRAVARVLHCQAPQAGVQEHVAVHREHHVRAVEVERHARHGRRRRRRRRQREAQVEPRRRRPVCRRQRHQRDDGGADLLVRRVDQRRERRAGVDDEPAGAVGVQGEGVGRDGQRRRAEGYAGEVEVVVGTHGRLGRAGDEWRGTNAGGAVERRRRAEEERAGAVGVLERREAVGEHAGGELRDERQGPPAQPDEPLKSLLLALLHPKVMPGTRAWQAGDEPNVNVSVARKPDVQPVPYDMW